MPWLAMLVVLAHVLAPGFHAIGLRIERQRGEVARSCCMAGERFGGGDHRGADQIGDRRTRLIRCAIGTLLLTNHGYVPRLTTVQVAIASPIGRPEPRREAAPAPRRATSPSARGPPA